MRKTETFAYWVVEAALAGIFHTTEGPQRLTFRSRLGDAQKLGVLRGAGPGKGARHPYRRADIYRLAFFFTALELGVSRAVAATIVERHWKKALSPAFAVAESAFENGDEDVLLAVSGLRAMSANWAPQPDRTTIDVLKVSEFQRVVLRKHKAEPPGMLIVNVSELISSLDGALSEIEFKTTPPVVTVSEVKRHG